MEGLPKKLSLPKLSFEFYEDRVVVRKLTKDAMDGINPWNDLLFLGPLFEYWKKGPVWLDESGHERLEQGNSRLIEDSDTGWVHYFNDGWTKEEREKTFSKYVCVCLGGDETIVFYPSGITLSLKDDDRIVFGEKILHIFDPQMDEDGKDTLYKKWIKKVIRGFLENK